jgi:hypothetical protein
MKTFNFYVVLFAIMLVLSASCNRETHYDDEHTVAVYYFPNYHIDPRNEAHFGSGWTEWELVRQATPRFEGHIQPLVPYWGYADEADPIQMAQKIETAADHGIDVFIFDWYYYDDGLFLERALEQGFMQAPNNDQLKFCLMWANHDYINIFPYTAGTERPLMFPGIITKETWNIMTDYIIETYFKHSSYWMLDGAAYFSVYDLSKFLAIFESLEDAKAGIETFRQKTIVAGFKDLHMNAVVWGNINLITGEVVDDPASLLADLGFSSVTSYVWFHHAHQEMDYPTDTFDHFMEVYFAYAERAATANILPYFPNVTMGWDSSPRTNQQLPHSNAGYPYTSMIIGNTPEKFQEALKRSRDFMDTHLEGNKVLTINSWNEWTEGSYLEPDMIHKMQYLEAVKNVFGVPLE